MIRHRSARSLSLGFLAVGLLLSGCEQAEETDQTEASLEESGVQTFTPEVDESVEPMGDRLPASEGRTALIAATELFPGTVKVESDIKNPYAGDAEAIAEGERHFAAFNCAGCHAPLGGGGMGPPLSDDEWIYGSAPGEVYLTILHGRPEGMPAFGSMLPEKTIWELAAYIDTLDEIEDYAAEKDFDENVGGFRDTDTQD